MINTILVKENTRASEILFFDRIEISSLSNRRIVPLFGANGSGKTTLLRAIEDYVERERKISKYEQEMRGEKGSEKEDLSSIMISLNAPTDSGIEEYWKKLIEEEELKKQVLFPDKDAVPTSIIKYRNSEDNFRSKESRGLFDDFDIAMLNARWEAKSLSEGQSIVYSVNDLLNRLMPGKTDLVPEGTHGIVLLDELDSGLSLDNLDMALRKIRKIVTKRNDIQIFMSLNTSYVLKYFPEVISMYDGKVLKIRNEEEMLAVLKENKKKLDKARKSRGKYKIFE